MIRRIGAQVRRSRLVATVVAAARKARLFGPGEHLLVCVSGGPDSVCLLAVLKELAPAWRLTLSVAHVNHGLRGLESDEDAEFVARLCEQMQLPFLCEAVDLRAAQGGTPGKLRARAMSSLQERAREARYATLRALARRIGADRIATGHTADDQAETLLLWMLRGAGTAGLAGIPQTRDGIWIRPLLGVTRAAILADLEERGQGFRMDSSNSKPVYLRNRVRHELLPILARLNPGVVKVLGRQSRILRDEDRCMEDLAGDHVERLVRQTVDGPVVVERAALMALSPALQRRVVRAVVRRVTGFHRGPSFGAVEAVLDRVVRGRSGAALTVAGTLAWRDYRSIRFQALSQSPAVAQDETPGPRTVSPTVTPGTVATVPWPWTRQVIRLALADGSWEGFPKSEPQSRTWAALDADRFTLPVTLRTWLPGDWFQPAGMHGKRKKLQDHFSDVKLPRTERRRIPILSAPEGILWVCGQRTDERFRATATTTRVLVAELRAAESEGPERGVVD
jgi:tRNA(Ile)-lysidine synthase